MLVNAVKERNITHFAQEELDGKSGGFGFDSTANADATLIEACALAYWGAMTTKRKPGRKAKVR